jgi:DNA-binding transcriptional regulator LsrR (DeoR family)
MTEKMEKQLDKVQSLLIHNLAIQLYVNGCTKEEIARHLHIHKTAVIKMLNGIELKQHGKE